MTSMKSFVNKKVGILMIVVLLLVALANFGFAAQNTVNPTYAGEGSTTVSGWTVDTDVILSSADPTMIDRIDLQFSGSTTYPDNVWIEFRGGAASACTTTDDINWQCDITNVAVYDGTNATDSLTVIADADTIS